MNQNEKQKKNFKIRYIKWQKSVYRKEPKGKKKHFKIRTVK